MRIRFHLCESVFICGKNLVAQRLGTLQPGDFEKSDSFYLYVQNYSIGDQRMAIRWLSGETYPYNNWHGIFRLL